MRYLVVIAAMLVFAAGASARPPVPATPPAPPPTAPQVPGATLTSPATGGGLLGSPDVTQSLGGTDADCSHLRGASPTVVQNCKASGLAESAYPPGNFGTDTHVDTGITDPGNDMASIAQEFIGGIYSLIAHVLTWILLGLGLAFGFDLFGQDHAHKIAGGLANAERLFSFPLIPVVLIVGAIIGLVYWFGQRAEGRAVVHWGGMLALMAAGLIIASNPVGVLGWVDNASNGMASGALAAFSGQGGGTSAGFANAVPGIYRTTMEEPWCAMEFGNVGWCMGPVDPQMAAARRAVLAHLPDALGDQGSKQLASQQEPTERLRLAAAKTNGELFLAFIPNADARNGQNDDWTFYHALLQERPDLAAIRGPGGVWERFAILFLAGIAGIFFLVLLLYIAWQLIVNSVFFVVCLLLTPIVILAPAFGETGRAVFFRWLVWMLEALAKRVIFAIYLGVILLVSNVFFSIGPSTGGWLVQWLLLAGIWAMGFLYRHKIIGVMTAGFYYQHAHPSVQSPRNKVSDRWQQRRPSYAETTEHHHYTGDHHHGDTYNQHAHVYGNARPEPRPVSAFADVVEGQSRELGE